MATEAVQKRTGSRYSPHSGLNASQISPSVASARTASSIGGTVFAIGSGRLDHPRQRRVDRCLVAGVAPLGDQRALLEFDLVRDPQDLQLVADVAGQRVDADDALVALLQLLAGTRTRSRRSRR